jgi:hypothetical protein
MIDSGNRLCYWLCVQCTMLLRCPVIHCCGPVGTRHYAKLCPDRVVSLCTYSPVCKVSLRGGFGVWHKWGGTDACARDGLREGALGLTCCCTSYVELHCMQRRLVYGGGLPSCLDTYTPALLGMQSTVWGDSPHAA